MLCLTRTTQSIRGWRENRGTQVNKVWYIWCSRQEDWKRIHVWGNNYTVFSTFFFMSWCWQCGDNWYLLSGVIRICTIFLHTLQHRTLNLDDSPEILLSLPVQKRIQGRIGSGCTMEGFLFVGWGAGTWWKKNHLYGPPPTTPNAEGCLAADQTSSSTVEGSLSLTRHSWRPRELTQLQKQPLVLLVRTGQRSRLTFSNTHIHHHKMQWHSDSMCSSWLAFQWREPTRCCLDDKWRDWDKMNVLSSSNSCTANVLVLNHTFELKPFDDCDLKNYDIGDLISHLLSERCI